MLVVIVDTKLLLPKDVSGPVGGVLHSSPMNLSHLQLFVFFTALLTVNGAKQITQVDPIIAVVLFSYHMMPASLAAAGSVDEDSSYLWSSVVSTEPRETSHNVPLLPAVALWPYSTEESSRTEKVPVLPDERLAV